jgi:Rrf2 family protein
MIGISKKLMLSIMAVSDIANNSGDRPVRSTGICERQGIPARYLEPVLQKLVRNGILIGVRGPQGGYRLGREPASISLARISEAVEATSEATDIDADHVASRLWTEIVLPLSDDLAAKWTAQLERITVEDLCLPRREA